MIGKKRVAGNKRFTKDQIRAIMVMSLAGMLVMYVETMIIPALPTMLSQFHTNLDLLSWVIAAYMISGTVSSVLFGKLADIYGKKKMFLISAGLYVITIMFGGFASTLSVFIMLRAVQGTGMAMFPIAFSLIRDEFNPEDIALAQGVVSATFTGGSSLGLVAGAYVTQNYGWQWNYHLVIPVALLLFFTSWKFIKESSLKTKSKIDYPGIVLFSSSIVLALIAISEGQYWGWESVRIVALIMISIFLFVFFLIVETKVSSPMIDLRLMGSRDILLANFIGLFAVSGLFFLYYTIPPLLENPPPAGFGESIIATGLTTLPASVVAMIIAPFAAMITRKKGPKLAIAIGILIEMSAFLALLYNRSNYISITEDSFILGLGTSFIFVGIINMLVLATPKEKIGIATGLNQLFRNFGGAIAPAVAGVIEVQYQEKVILSEKPVIIAQYFPSSAAFDHIYMIGFLVMLFTLFLVFLTKNGKNI